jgi:uncharacterized membrane protein YoaK (UPF0700 family)
MISDYTRDPRHGPLPALLLVLTVLTGVIDSVSILSLGRVFVANMTGNIVFVGFAAAGAPGFSLAASLFALGGFLAGALAAGQAVGRLGGRRGLLFRGGVSAELLLVIVALIISLAAGQHRGGAATDAIAALAAMAMGIQNTVARRLAVPELTTTVLTMTLTGLASDWRAGVRAPVMVRRLLAVAAMLGGAVAGALLVLHNGSSAGLILAAGLLAVVTAGALAATRRPAPWQTAQPAK